MAQDLCRGFAHRRCGDWTALEVSARRIALGRPGMGITLNGIAQGYAADLALGALRERGIHDAVIDTGKFGAEGRRGPQQPWTIAIQHPRVANGSRRSRWMDGSSPPRATTRRPSRTTSSTTTFSIPGRNLFPGIEQRAGSRSDRHGGRRTDQADDGARATSGARPALAVPRLGDRLDRQAGPGRDVPRDAPEHRLTGETLKVGKVHFLAQRNDLSAGLAQRRARARRSLRDPVRKVGRRPRHTLLTAGAPGGSFSGIADA